MSEPALIEDEQVALQIIREWVVELDYGHLPPGKISDLTDRIATALRTQREALEGQITALEKERDEAQEGFAKWYGRAMATAQECQRLNSEK